MEKLPSVKRRADGAWETRLRFGAKQRYRFELAGCTTERAAQRRAAALAAMGKQLANAGKVHRAFEILMRAANAPNDEELAAVRTLVRRLASGHYDGAEAAVPSPKMTTFRELADEWADGELHRLHPHHVKEKRSAEDDRLRFEKHIFPVVGSVPLAEFTLDHAELVMSGLPRKFSSASRRHVAQLIHRVLALAVYPARIRTASPIPRGWLPELDNKKAFPILRPDEDAALLSCPKVPLDYRLLYGFLHREGMRRSEAVGLRWRDVDLKVATVSLDENKTNRPRFWKMAPGVAEALAAWWKLRGEPASTDAVFVESGTDGIDVEHLAARVRQHLLEAQIKRHELHEKGTNRGRFTAHGFRHSFVTRSLATGKTDDWVRQRTGHRSNELLRYRESAPSLAELELGDVLPLVEAIPELNELHDRGVTSPTRGEQPTSAERVGQKVGQKVGQTEKRSGATIIPFPSNSRR